MTDYLAKQWVEFIYDFRELLLMVESDDEFLLIDDVRLIAEELEEKYLSILREYKNNEENKKDYDEDLDDLVDVGIILEKLKNVKKEY